MQQAVSKNLLHELCNQTHSLSFAYKAATKKP